VERGGDVAGLQGGGRGAEAPQGEGEVVGAGPRVGGRRRVGRDGRAEEQGRPPGRCGGEEDEKREEQERCRPRGEREEASAAGLRVVMAVAARHSGASEWPETESRS
jgi:hypothetical protein